MSITVFPPEALAAIESIRADAARASAAAQQASAAAQQASQALRENAPGVAEGIRRGGTGIQQFGPQTSSALRYASDRVSGAAGASTRFFASLVAGFLGLAAGATVLVFATRAHKANRRPRRHARKVNARRARRRAQR